MRLPLAGFSKHLFFAIAYGLRFAASSWRSRRCADPRQVREETLGALLHDYALRTGPLSIKVGQIVASHGALLPRRVNEALRALQDRVPQRPFDEIRGVVEASYGAPLEETFREFSREAVASASIAQVHRAVLHDGREVAVKVVKAGIRDQMQSALRMVSICARGIHRAVPPARQLDLPGHFEQLAPLLREQCDLEHEVVNQLEIRANYENHPYARIPAPVVERCTRDVLVMDFVRGLSADESDRLEISRESLAQRMADELYTMIFLHGVFHADPHPGNIVFAPTGEIHLLDFGLVGRLGEEERLGLAGFFFACVRQEWRIAAERFTRNYVVARDRIAADRERYLAELEAVLAEHFRERSSRWSMLDFAYDANALLRRYGARASTSFTTVMLAFLSGEGFVASVDPALDVWANARAFADRVAPYVGAVRERFDTELGARIPKSRELQRRASSVLVAPTHFDRMLLPSVYPILVEDASGCRIRDVDGNEYIDLSCGYGPHFLGYAHPTVAHAVSEAIQRGAVNAIGNEAEIRLAELIVDALPAADRVIFASTGTEAVLMALRLCRGYRRRQRVAKFEGHYHGWSDHGSVSSWFRFSGSDEAPGPTAPSLGSSDAALRDTLVLQYGDERALDSIRAHADELSAVVCEPMPSASLRVEEEFLRQLRSLCDELDLPLVFDEVITGFRCTWGGLQNLIAVEPDLTCLGKIIGGGLPCGAVAGRAHLIDLARTAGDPFLDLESRVLLGGTLSGNSVSCAAGAAVLEYLSGRPEIYERQTAHTAWLLDQLRDAACMQGVALQIEGRHSIFSLHFDYQRRERIRQQHRSANFRADLALAYHMRCQGVYVPELHTLMLSAAHTRGDLEVVASAFEKSLGEMTHDRLFSL